MRNKLNSAAAALALTASVTGCAGGSSAPTTDEPQTPSSAAQIDPPKDGPQVKTKASVTLKMIVDGPFEGSDLDKLAASSEVVLRGSVVDAVAGQELSDDPEVSYTVFTVRSTEIFDGESTRDVRVALLTMSGGQSVQLNNLQIPEVGSQGVFFLTPIPELFEVDGYVLTNTESFVSTSGGVLPPADQFDGLHDDLELLDTPAELFEVLRE